PTSCQVRRLTRSAGERQFRSAARRRNGQKVRQRANSGPTHYDHGARGLALVDWVVVSPTAMVATDLDGTLIRSDGTVSARTRRALRRVREQGGTVVLVTGRPIRVMADVVAQTSVTGIAVCANGAL